MIVTLELTEQEMLAVRGAIREATAVRKALNLGSPSGLSRALGILEAAHVDYQVAERCREVQRNKRIVLAAMAETSE
jgi:hypothetical protein